MSSPHDLIHAQARQHLDIVKQAYRDALGRRDEPINDDGWLALLKVFLTAHPMRAMTMEQAALHEAAHFVFFELLGFLASTAEIQGSCFGRHGWGGLAAPLNRPAYYFPQYLVPDDFLRDAQAALAGPIAEELLGGGDVLGSIGELIDAALRSDRAAQLLGRDDIEMWDATLLAAVALVERHESEIRDIAAALERKKRISRTDSAVSKTLMRVEEAPIDVGSVSQRGLALAHRITEALREFAQ